MNGSNVFPHALMPFGIHSVSTVGHVLYVVYISLHACRGVCLIKVSVLVTLRLPEMARPYMALADNSTVGVVASFLFPLDKNLSSLFQKASVTQRKPVNNGEKYRTRCQEYTSAVTQKSGAA